MVAVLGIVQVALLLILAAVLLSFAKQLTVHVTTVQTSVSKVDQDGSVLIVSAETHVSLDTVSHNQVVTETDASGTKSVETRVTIPAITEVDALMVNGQVTKTAQWVSGVQVILLLLHVVVLVTTQDQVTVD